MKISPQYPHGKRVCWQYMRRVNDEKWPVRPRREKRVERERRKIESVTMGPSKTTSRKLMKTRCAIIT